MYSKIFTLLFLFALNASAQNAFIQFLNTSADVNLTTAKISVDDVNQANLAFRTASTFLPIDATGGKLIKIDVLNQSDSLVYSQTDILIEPGKNYLCVLQGVLDPSLFRANPNDKDNALKFLWIENAQKDTIPDGSPFSYLIINSVTDAPELDFKKDSVLVADNVPYGEAEGYFDVTEGIAYFHLFTSDGSINLYSYKTSFSTPVIPVTLFLSGFITPSANQNGKVFELLALLPDGSVVTLTNTTPNRDQVLKNKDFTLYPNPTKSKLFIKTGLDITQKPFTYTIYSYTGSMVKQPNQYYNSEINISDLPVGIYYLELQIDKQKLNLPFMKH